MRKFWTVLGHTYMSRIRTKSFIILTIVVAVLLIGVSNLNQIINLFDSNSAEKIAVLDQSGQFFTPLNRQVKKTTDDLKLIHYKKSEKQAAKSVKSGDFEGYLILAKTPSGLPKATYKSEKIAEEKISGKLKDALQQVKINVATQKLGLNQQQIAKIYTPVSFDKVALDKGAKSEKELMQARIIVYILVFLMFFSVMMYGVMIAMEVATEKSSRVMEILISSVSPVKQMFGKIIGVTLVGLTQFAFLAAVGYVSFRIFGSGFGSGTGFLSYLSFDALPPLMFVYALVFFILGFFLFATLLAMLGSLVSRVEEAQQTLMPVTMVLLAGFYIAMYGLADPNASLITVTSFIPFFAPMIMLLRIGLLSVPFWQIGLSVMILIATTIVFVIIGAQVYRGGVLMYGKSSWKNIRHALALSKAERS
ncbi:MAG TPA: ABC transporter permease [Bacillales bacterium]|nr:ABC transporter permease [Bacillales bacterium]